VSQLTTDLFQPMALMIQQHQAFENSVTIALVEPELGQNCLHRSWDDLNKKVGQ